SLLITVGIVSSLPGTISSVVNSIIDSSSNFVVFGKTLPINKDGLILGAILTAIVVVVTVLIVKINEARREITINYAKRVQGNRAYGGVTTILPIKLITAGVIPIIFAVAFLSVPSFVGQLMTGSSSARLQEIGNNLLLWFQTPSATTFQQPGFEPYIYPVVYFFLVFVFTFFYTSITFNSKE